MFFLPSGILILLILLLLLPVLFFLAFFHLITLGFEKLGISYSATIAILFLMLIGSVVNIPITKRKFFYAKRRYFFGIFEDTRLVPSGIAVNLGGAVLPVLMSLYFMQKVPLKPVLIMNNPMGIKLFDWARQTGCLLLYAKKIEKIIAYCNEMGIKYEKDRQIKDLKEETLLLEQYENHEDVIIGKCKAHDLVKKQLEIKEDETKEPSAI